MDIKDLHSSQIETSCKLRGYIINQIVILEKFMDFYIANFYCSDKSKRNHLVEYLLPSDKVNLRSKKAVLVNILKVTNPAFLKNHEGINKTFDDFIELRNILAHQMVDFTSEGIENFSNNVVTFFKTGHDENPSYNEKFISDTQQKLVNWIKYLIGLVNEE